MNVVGWFLTVQQSDQVSNIEKLKAVTDWLLAVRQNYLTDVYQKNNVPRYNDLSPADVAYFKRLTTSST
jgi:hypothetical protein